MNKRTRKIRKIKKIFRTLKKVSKCLTDYETKNLFMTFRQIFKIFQHLKKKKFVYHRIGVHGA